MVGNFSNQLAELPSHVNAGLGGDWAVSSIPLALSSVRVLRSARVEAAKLRHRYVGTEHVLLAVTLETEPTRDLLRGVGVDVPTLRRRLAEMTAPSDRRLGEALEDYFELSLALRAKDLQDVGSVRMQLHTEVLEAMEDEYKRAMILALEASQRVEQAVERARHQLNQRRGGKRRNG